MTDILKLKQAKKTNNIELLRSYAKENIEQLNFAILLNINLPLDIFVLFV